MPVSLALFTRDLRVHDNAMLTAAATAGEVLPLFVVSRTDFAGPNRAAFLTGCLRDLARGLADRGGALVIRYGDPAAVVANLVREHDITRVHVSADASAYAHRRERALREAVGDRLVVHDDVVPAVAPTGPFEPVFTPFFQRWNEVPPRTPLPAPGGLRLPSVDPGELPSAETFSRGIPAPGLPPGGERHGRALLDFWARTGVHRYPEDRDDLARQGSSHLSAHLHFGSLSAAETRHAVGAHAGQLVRQLAWRDFYLRVLAARPDAAWRDYRDRGDRWRHAPADLLAWQRGRTGYPVVDAAMRQLTTEGWLPNRARLLAASFLCKTLYLDWRPGAAFFLHHLVDGDLASNQLNWQWVAGTGTDTRPGRVLDPVWHGEQHDPDGAYVHRYVPELRSVPGPLVHRPWELDASVRSGLDYPGPVVGLEEGYARFVSARRKHKQGKQRNRRR